MCGCVSACVCARRRQAKGRGRPGHAWVGASPGGAPGARFAELRRWLSAGAAPPAAAPRLARDRASGAAGAGGGAPPSWTAAAAAAVKGRPAACTEGVGGPLGADPSPRGSLRGGYSCLGEVKAS